jgi:molybdopterin converting factor small subunit
MAITVRSLRPLSESIGGSKIELEWQGETLLDLIRLLAGKRGTEVEKELIGEDGSFAYVVSINGKTRRDLSAPIRDGDEIFFFAPMGGG